MTIPMRRMKIQHIPSRIRVNERGGLPLMGDSDVDCSSKDDVGIGVGVLIWITNGAPETGMMVGTYVGVACAVG
jgi:hypothetical protein